MPMRAFRVIAAAILALWLGLLLTAGGASAQSCSLSITPLVFAPVDVTANAQVDSTATATVTCTGLPLQLVGVCIDLGPGSGGATDATNRFMVNGANQLRYGLFSNAGATPWGSSAWAAGGAAPVGLNVNLSLGGTGSQSVIITGRVFGGQPTVAPLAYASTLSGIDARIRYGLLSFLLGCNLLTISQTSSFTVSANVPPTCRVTANDLNFGSVGVLSGQRDASTNLAPTCTNGTAYQVGLDGGVSNAANPTLRRMTKGAEFVTYGLYRDAGRVQPFGGALGADTLAGSGTGLAQTATVYGRVPPQATPSPGIYGDTIVVTLTY
ncbi:spore coat protein u [Bosea caraganae]|uniref:Spore coat protein u n=1 Tax=Bosea caraganae TaxID=2763117 RepID=A0A370L8W5_9HYPH|nr:spore coat U domain-containing protein [Bosea caraganae]RDJ26831.1 spore coat protein u [Bosea caraganae]RDJ30717.1 spore coat protein u [Bosea caraganae]